MLQADGLPLSEVVQSEKWQAAFDRHDVHFGNDPEATYTPAITPRALISQVFFKAENRSCKAADSRVAS